MGLLATLEAGLQEGPEEQKFPKLIRMVLLQEVFSDRTKWRDWVQGEGERTGKIDIFDEISPSPWKPFTTWLATDGATDKFLSPLSINDMSDLPWFVPCSDALLKFMAKEFKETGNCKIAYPFMKQAQHSEQFYCKIVATMLGQNVYLKQSAENFEPILSESAILSLPNVKLIDIRKNMCILHMNETNSPKRNAMPEPASMSRNESHESVSPPAKKAAIAGQACKAENSQNISITRAAEVAAITKTTCSDWEIWDSTTHTFDPPGSGKFHFDYSANHQERILVIMGEATLTPDDGMPPVTIRTGDYVVFHRGFKCTWNVTSPMKKRYAWYDEDGNRTQGSNNIECDVCSTACWEESYLMDDEVDLCKNCFTKFTRNKSTDYKIYQKQLNGVNHGPATATKVASSPVERAEKRPVPQDDEQIPKRVKVESPSTAAPTDKSPVEDGKVPFKQCAADGVRDAPVFHPTAEEFEDSIAYLSSPEIAEAGAKYGVIIIRPPPNWKPPPNPNLLKKMTTQFATRKQQVHNLTKAENFAEGNYYDWTSFRARADVFRKRHIEKWGVQCQTPNAAQNENAIEEEFWKVVHGKRGYVEVEYGADLDSSDEMIGSVFTMDTENPDHERYAKSTWNFNRLPELNGSLLRFLTSKMSGISAPWVYIGMAFSAFCWHNEDLRMHSLNYLHLGYPKVWYGVPGCDAEKFSNFFRKFAPELFEKHPDLLFKLLTLLPPQAFVQEGIPICRAVQHAGEFVVTFPRAYHGGFSTGFNCAEAVNFALGEWIPHGRSAVPHYRDHQKPPPFSVDEITIRTACALHRKRLVDSTGEDKALMEILQDDIDTITEEEVKLREDLKQVYSPILGRIVDVEQRDMSDDARRNEVEECATCAGLCFLSWLQDASSPQMPRIICLHSKCREGIDISRLTLFSRAEPEDVNNVLKKGGSWLTRHRKGRGGSRLCKPSVSLEKEKELAWPAPRPGVNQLTDDVAEDSTIPTGWFVVLKKVEGREKRSRCFTDGTTTLFSLAAVKAHVEALEADANANYISRLDDDSLERSEGESGFKGVYKMKKASASKRWGAMGSFRGRQVMMGSAATPLDAARLRRDWLRKKGVLHVPETRASGTGDMSDTPTKLENIEDEDGPSDSADDMAVDDEEKDVDVIDDVDDDEDASSEPPGASDMDEEVSD